MLTARLLVCWHEPSSTSPLLLPGRLSRATKPYRSSYERARLAAWYRCRDWQLYTALRFGSHARFESGNHITRDQVAKWDRVDGERVCPGVVAVVGIFVDVEVAIRHDDEISIAHDSGSGYRLKPLSVA